MTASVLNGVYVAALVLESGVGVADADVRCVLDIDVCVGAASVKESGVCVSAADVSCVSESDIWVVVAAGVTTLCVCVCVCVCVCDSCVSYCD
jgi:hypothetical protein